MIVIVITDIIITAIINMSYIYHIPPFLSIYLFIYLFYLFIF